MRGVTGSCVLAVLLPVACLAAENVTITTYYPSPHGVYRDLRLAPSDEPVVNGAADEGRIYFNNTNHGFRLYHYNGTDYEWTPSLGGAGASFWSMNLSQNSIHNNNNANVSIGTNNSVAPLTVEYGEASPVAASEEPRFITFVKHLNGYSTDQWLSFYLFPPATAFGAYHAGSTMVYACSNPPENLTLAAAGNTSSISFNVGNYSDQLSEVMRLTNPCYVSGSATCPRVGIGTTNPQFPLQVDSGDEEVAPLVVRAERTNLKSGRFNIVPIWNRTYMAYGLIWQNDAWHNDPYEYPSGTFNHYGGKFGLQNDRGAFWNAYDSTAGNNVVVSWNRAADLTLWDLNGTWVSNVTLANDDTLACNAGNAGLVKYNGTGFYGCNGTPVTGWLQLKQ